MVDAASYIGSNYLREYYRNTPVSTPAKDYTGPVTSNGKATFFSWSNPISSGVDVIKKTLAQKGDYIQGKYNDLKSTPNQDYHSVDDKGINYKGSSQNDAVVAQYGQKVAKDLNTESGCYTGVKHALTSAGVLKDYGEMPKGDAKNATEYFDKHPEKFEKVDARTTEDLKKLPAGRIVVYENSQPDKSGHIGITNGNGQEYSDHTGNMNWNEEHQGIHNVYKLTDGWQYNPVTKKLEFQE